MLLYGCTLINHIDISPNGKYFISAGYDSDIILWEESSHKKIRTFSGHAQQISSVFFSKNGKKIISSSLDLTIKIWDVKSGKLINTINDAHHEDKDLWFLVAKYTPDNTIVSILSGENSAKIKVIDIETQKILQQFEGPTGIVTCAIVSPNGKELITVSNNTIKLWDIKKGNLLKNINTSVVGAMYSIDITSDGEKIVISGDRDIVIWDIKNEILIKNIDIGASSVDISHDNKTFISTCRGELIEWDLNTGDEIRSIEEKYESYITKFYDNGNHFISGGGTQREGSKTANIKIWDSQMFIEPININNMTSEVRSLVFSSNGKMIASSGADYRIKFWNFDTEVIFKEFHIEGQPLQSAVFFPDNKRIIAAAFPFFIWNIKDNKQFIEKKWDFFADLHDQVIAISPNGNMIARNDRSNVVIIDLKNEKTTVRLEGHLKRVSSIAFSPNGLYIISGSYDGNIKLWNTQTGLEVRTFKGHTGKVFSVAFFPDGKKIISGSEDNTMKVWDIQSGNNIKSFNDRFSISNICISPNGNTIASGSPNGIIKLWNLNKEKEIKTIQAHNFVSSVMFSPSGEVLISGGGDGKINFWRVSDGKLLITLYGLFASEDYVAVTLDGRFYGTKKGIDLLHLVEGMDIIPLSSLYEQFYTPNLLARVMAGEEFKEPEIKIDDLKLPPLVEITSPQSHQKLNNNQLTVNVKITDQGGGIDEIRLYLNGKLIETTQRGFVKIEQNNNVKIKFFTIILTNGENKIKATAFNKQRTESIPDEITVFYEGVKKTANLHMLVIGIDNYKNTKYNLNYAVADATSFKEEIEKNSSAIFGNINITFLKDADATKERIIQEFENIKQQAKQEDVFIFYYAGHGVMSMDDKAEFHIIPYNVTKLYDYNETLNANAISANELQTFSTELKAQKQMFVFDACQSGGMTEFLAARGAAEEKAIAQLARSTGTYWLTASGTEQYATEFAELGHGLFTYCILLGLQGQADGGDKDKKITVTELSAFLNDKVPELSEKYKGTPQYPNTYGRGMDFPIIIVK